jgi:hypothetical protein
MKAKLLLTLIFALLLLCLFSCNPYKKIAVAPKITPANKELLSQTCERYFPPEQPKFIKGETIRDTLKVTDTVTVIDTFNNLVTKIVTNKVIIDNSRTDTFYLPPSQYLVNKLNTTIESLEKQHNEDLIKIAVLENDNEKLKQQNRKNQFTKFSGWGLIVLILGIYGFIKLKLK